MRIEDYVHLLKYCGVPKRYADEILSLFAKIDNLEKSNNVYLYGDAGTGKTLTAVKLILLSLFENKRIKYITEKFNVLSNEYDPGYAQKLEHLFVRVPDLVSQIRATFNYKSGQINIEEQETERSIIEKYSKVDFLVLDDFGAEKITDWSFSVLYLIIDNRYNNYKKTIITSNYPLNQLAEKLGDDRIPSRIRAMCYIVKMGGKDKRKPAL